MGIVMLMISVNVALTNYNMRLQLKVKVKTTSSIPQKVEFGWGLKVSQVILAIINNHTKKRRKKYTFHIQPRVAPAS